MATKTTRGAGQPRHQRAAYLRRVAPRIAGSPAPPAEQPADRAVSALAAAADSVEQLGLSTDDRLARILIDRALQGLAVISEDLRFVRESA